jgi:hypothetical protein
MTGAGTTAMTTAATGVVITATGMMTD